MTAERMIPQTQDRETAPFFQAALEGKLVIKHCKDCDNGVHPPSAICPHCGSWNTEWKEVSGRGKLYTWTAVEHTVHPAYPAPYTIVVVQLDDIKRVRLVGDLPGRPEMKEGMPMKVRFQKLADGVVLPNWDVA